MTTKLWGKQISGPCLAICALISLLVSYIYRNSPTGTQTIFQYSALATFTLSVLLIFVAQYQAWSETRDKYEIELKANQLPCLKGTISNVRPMGAFGHGFDGTRHTCNARYSFELYICNHRARQTNLQNLELDGSHLVPPVSFYPVEMINGQVLLDGRGMSIAGLYVMVEVEGFTTYTDVPDIDLTQLRVYAIDGFLGKHPIAVGDGERLVFH